MAYQTPYSGSPYGPGIPSSNAPQPQLPHNFNMMAAGAMPGFPMNAAGMSQQQAMMQRMHPAQQNVAQMGVSTPQRQFSAPHGTPGGSMPAQPQHFSTPQNHQPPPQSQTPTNSSQQPPSAAVSTPQTPTFPSSMPASGANGTSSVSTPLSPGSESREKEAFSILLDINSELLCESLALQNTQHELQKEQTAIKGEDGTPAEQGKKQPSDDEKLVQMDYVQCMRRLHSNLAYLASLADRKGSVSVAKGPQYLLPPTLNLKIKMRGPVLAPLLDSSDNKPDLNADREDREKSLKELYRRLQALYPGVDPKVAFPATAAHPEQGGGMGQKHGGAHGSNQASPAPSHQKTPQMATVSAPHNHAQAVATS